MIRAAILALTICLVAALPAAAAEQNVVIPTRAGVTQRFVLTEAENPAAQIVFFKGANGFIGPTGKRPEVENIFSLAPELFAARGITVAMIDVPSDRRRSGLWNFRDSDEHRADVAAVIAWLKARRDAPVWLAGMSRGAVSVAHLGATLPPGTVAGLVLMSAVTVAGRNDPDTAVKAKLEKIAVPVLIVHHTGDTCFASPPSDDRTIARRLAAAPKVETRLFEGGSTPKSDACEVLAPHGYFGIEAQVVDAIAGWIAR